MQNKIAKKRLTINIYQNNYTWLMEYCADNDVTITNQIRKIIKQWCEFKKEDENE